MKNILYILIFLILISFAGLVEIPNSVTVNILILLISICCYKKGMPFNKILILLGFCFVANFISSKINRGQSYLDTLRASLPILAIYSTWLFYRLHFSVRKWEKILYYSCFIFGICFIIQELALPKVIFSGQIRTEGEMRIALCCQGLGSFSVLFALNKIIYKHEKKYIPILVLGVLAVFGCGYRSMLLALAISCLILLLRLGSSRRTIIPVIISILVVCLLITYVPFINEQITNMLDRQADLKSSGFENDIRYQNLLYHYGFFFTNPWEMIFGAGEPYEMSSYGKYYKDFIIDTLNYWDADWGLIGLSWLIGIPAVLVMIYYSIKMFLIKVPKEYLYIGIYFFNIVISSITSHEFYMEGNFVVQAVIIALFTTLLKEKNIPFTIHSKGRRS